ncbi:MAG: protein BatD [Caldilineales bacterium]|nr:protein BatD [Caldilineales bacterium]
MSKNVKVSARMRSISRRMTFIFALMVAAISLWPAAAFAQSRDDALRVSVDRDIISMDETLVLTILVNDLGNPPTLPALDGFDIVAQSTQSQINIMNGAQFFSSAYQYRLRPKRVGDLLIGPVTLFQNGQSYSSEPIIISVTQGMAVPRSTESGGEIEAPPKLEGQDFYVESEIDNASPYQGEQALYTFRFYQTKETFQQPQYEGPSFTGFWHGEDIKTAQYTTEAAGRNYLVTEFQTAVVPTVVDDLTIDPATIEIPGGFFTRYQLLSSQSLEVQAQPLPDGAPAGFGGAVGRFDLTAEVDNTEVSANDTVTLRVTVSGEGNIETMPDVTLPDSTDWRFFADTPEVKSEIIDGKLTGSRTMEWVLTPTGGGSLEIPSLSYSFFNPETETYETLSTDPIVVNVSGSAASASSAPVAASTDSLATAASSLRTLKMVAKPLRQASVPLTDRTGFWLLWLVPVGLVAAQALYQQRRRIFKHDYAERRRRQAASDANLALAGAVASGSGQEAIAPILRDYLAAKLGHSVAGMTESELANELINAGVRTQLAMRVCDDLAASDASRFAPTGAVYPSSTAILEAKRLIADLERALVV